MVYLAMSRTGTTTHRMLFLETPLDLPVLNIQLAAFGLLYSHADHFCRFFFLFYMLLNLVLLARTARVFRMRWRAPFRTMVSRAQTFRMRIENTLLVQLWSAR